MKIKKDNGASLTGFIITILVILLIVSVAGCVYLINNPIKEKVAIQTPSSVQTNMSNNQNNMIEENEIKVKQTKEMTADEKYNIYLGNLKNNLLKMKDVGESPDGENKVDKFLFISEENFTLENNKIGNLSIEYNGDAYLNFTDAGTLSKKYGEKYKINTNVVNAGFQVHGQDVTTMLWFINDEGEFSYIDILQHGTTTLDLKKVENLKNIVSVSAMYNGEAFIPVAIDIEGNIFEVK